MHVINYGGFLCFFVVWLCYVLFVLGFFFCIGLHLLFFENKQITKKIVTYMYKNRMAQRIAL